MASRKQTHPVLQDRLPAGLRVTRQRSEVFDVLVESRDHPTATDVFLRVQDRAPGISLATVYNCLETLTGCDAIKQIQVDRGPARYCANLAEHVHFHCDSCGAVFDAPPLAEIDAKTQWKLPRGVHVESLDVTLRGLCPACAKDGSTNS